MIPLSTILGIAVLYDDYGLGPFDISGSLIRAILKIILIASARALRREDIIIYTLLRGVTATNAVRNTQ